MRKGLGWSTTVLGSVLAVSLGLAGGADWAQATGNDAGSGTAGSSVGANALPGTSVVAGETAPDRSGTDAGTWKSPMRARIEAAQRAEGTAHEGDRPAGLGRPGRADGLRARQSERTTEVVCDGVPEVLDGDFESLPRPDRGESIVYYGGETIHGVWTVWGSVELHRYKEGRHGIPQGVTLELNGDENGILRQQVHGLTPGVEHTLSFIYATSPELDAATCFVNVLDEFEDHGMWEFTSEEDVFGTWSLAEVAFTPSDDSVILDFHAGNDGEHGMVIDEVTMSCGPTPRIVDPGDQENQEGDTVALQLEAFGHGSFSFEADGLPAGLSIDDDGLISGTIEAHAAGLHWVEIFVEDDEDEGYLQFRWKVASVNGLVGHFPFDEGDGTWTEDASGHGNHGTLLDGTDWIPGVLGSGIEAAGESYVDVPPGPSLTPHGSGHTFAGWVRATDPEIEEHYGDEYGDGPTAGWGFSMLAFKGVFDEFADAGFFEEWDYYFLQYYGYLEGGFLLYNTELDEYNWGWVSAYDLPEDQWYHLAVTTDGLGFRVYVNGQLWSEGSWDYFGEGWELAGTGAPLQLGGIANYFWEDVLPSGLDDVRIYDRALDAEEVAELVGELGTFRLVDPGSQTNAFGDEVDLQLEAIGAGTFYAEGLPGALELDGESGRIVGEFGLCDVGTYEVWIGAESVFGDWDETSFIWTVTAPVGGLVPDGSFEEGTPVDDGEFERFSGGDFIHDVWYVGEGEVDLHHVDHDGIGDDLDASAGSHVLDLNGGEPGAVSVGIEGLIPGELYVLRLHCAAHPRRVASSADLALVEAGESWLVEVGPGDTPRGENWVWREFVFQAVDDDDALTLASRDPGAFGLVVDEISIFCAGPIRHDGDDLPVQGSSWTAPPPTATRLHLNQPNPFTSSTTIRYDLGTSTRVHVEVYAVDGRRVRTLVDGLETPGTKVLDWDGRDGDGNPLGSGAYLLRFRAGSHEETQRIVKVR